MKCIERRCRMLGIDAPAKVEHTGKDGQPIEVNNKYNFSNMPTEDLIKLNGHLESARNNNSSQKP